MERVAAARQGVIPSQTIVDSLLTSLTLRDGLGDRKSRGRCSGTPRPLVSTVDIHTPLHKAYHTGQIAHLEAFLRSKADHPLARHDVAPSSHHEITLWLDGPAWNGSRMLLPGVEPGKPGGLLLPLLLCRCMSACLRRLTVF